MGFLIIAKNESVPYEIPDQTGDGKPATLYVKRLSFSALRALRLEYGKGVDDPEKWEPGAFEKFQDEIIRRGYTGKSSGFFVSEDAGLREVTPTVEDLLEMPEDFRTQLTRRICFAFATFAPSSPKEGATLGNSSGT